MADYREDYYRALGVTPNASTDEIRQAWLRLISYWHPDRMNHHAAEDRAKELNRAYQVLANPDSREDYDRWYRAQVADEDGPGNEERPPWAASPPPEEPAPRPQREPRPKRETKRETKREAAGAQNGAANGAANGTGDPGAWGVVSGWEPPPPDYRHHPGIDPFTGKARVATTAPRQVFGYVLWMAGFATWLVLLGISIWVVSRGPNLVVETLVIALDVMCLWTWLFAIAAVFAKQRGEWWRFWAAELLGALTATCATLLIASIGMGIAVLTSPAGVSAFRDRTWVGAGLAVLALAGALGALTFRYVWQRWEGLRVRVRGRPRWERERAVNK